MRADITLVSSGITAQRVPGEQVGREGRESPRPARRLQTGLLRHSPRAGLGHLRPGRLDGTRRLQPHPVRSPRQLPQCQYRQTGRSLARCDIRDREPALRLDNQPADANAPPAFDANGRPVTGRVLFVSAPVGLAVADSSVWGASTDGNLTRSGYEPTYVFVSTADPPHIGVTAQRVVRAQLVPSAGL